MAKSIDAYFDEIRPDLFGAFWMRRRIEEELRGHLADAVDRHLSAGLSREEAEERAIEQLGSPRDVSRAFARSKGVGMPTKVTRWSGLALAVGAVGISIANAIAEFSWEFSRGSYAEIAVVFFALVGIGLVGIYIRGRGSMGALGRTGFRLVLSGVVIAHVSSMAWFVPGAFAGVVILTLGAATYFAGLHRSPDFPSGATALLGAALATCVVVGVGTTVAGVDAGAATAPLGALGFGGGFAWLGLHMWGETAEATVGAPPVAPA